MNWLLFTTVLLYIVFRPANQQANRQTDKHTDSLINDTHHEIFEESHKWKAYSYATDPEFDQLLDLQTIEDDDGGHGNVRENDDFHFPEYLERDSYYDIENEWNRHGNEWDDREEYDNDRDEYDNDRGIVYDLDYTQGKYVVDTGIFGEVEVEPKEEEEDDEEYLSYHNERQFLSHSEKLRQLKEQFTRMLEKGFIKNSKTIESLINGEFDHIFVDDDDEDGFEEEDESIDEDEDSNFGMDEDDNTDEDISIFEEEKEDEIKLKDHYPELYYEKVQESYYYYPIEAEIEFENNENISKTLYLYPTESLLNQYNLAETEVTYELSVMPDTEKYHFCKSSPLEIKSNAYYGPLRLTLSYTNYLTVTEPYVTEPEQNILFRVKDKTYAVEDLQGIRIVDFNDEETETLAEEVDQNPCESEPPAEEVHEPETFAEEVDLNDEETETLAEEVDQNPCESETLAEEVHEPETFAEEVDEPETLAEGYETEFEEFYVEDYEYEEWDDTYWDFEFESDLNW